MKQQSYKLSYLVRCTLLALGATVAVPALAADANQPTREVNIPAQSAASSLLEIAEKANVQIIFSPEALQSVHAPAVTGTYTVLEAIQRSLVNSELEVVQQDENIYVVRVRVTNAANDGAAVASGASTGRIERIQVVGSNIRG